MFRFQVSIVPLVPCFPFPEENPRYFAESWQLFQTAAGLYGECCLLFMRNSMRLAACEAARLTGDMSQRGGERCLPLETRLWLLLQKLTLKV